METLSRLSLVLNLAIGISVVVGAIKGFDSKVVGVGLLALWAVTASPALVMAYRDTVGSAGLKLYAVFAVLLWGSVFAFLLVAILVESTPVTGGVALGIGLAMVLAFTYPLEIYRERYTKTFRSCPYCTQRIKRLQSRCHHCQSWLVPVPSDQR